MDTGNPSDTALSPRGPSQVARSMAGAEVEALERGGASADAARVASPSGGAHPREDDQPDIVRLPGEPDLSKLGIPDPSDAAEGAAPSLHGDPRPAMAAPAHPKSHRSRWLGGTALATLVVLFGGAFLVSRYNHVVPLPSRVVARVHRLAAQAGLENKVLAPAATLAKVKVPPKPKAIVRPKYTPLPKSQQLAEITSLHAGSKAVAGDSSSTNEEGASGKEGNSARPRTARETGVASGAPGVGVPTEPGMAAAERAASVASTGKTEVTPPASAPPVAAKPKRISIAQALAEQTAAASKAPEAAKATHAATVASRTTSPLPVAPVATATQAKPSVLAVASHLEAAPMTPHGQVRVMQLVMKMAAILEAQRTAVAELEAEVETSTRTTRASLSDFDRRLTLLEATKAVAAAAATPLHLAVAEPVPVKHPVTVTHADAVLAVAPHGAKRYRLQAASPGLAMLAEIGRGGGAGAQLQVEVGNTIPGYGRVKSISQQGTSWVVVTQHGDIR